MSRRLDAKRSAPVFAALGDATRLEIVTLLCRSGPASIARLADGFDVTRQAVTKHLHVLEEAGLVKSSKHGREVVWELEPARLDDAKKWLDVVSQQWDDALERLRDFVER
jgi:DNA-binding transcriptional ArsR family regulator